MKKSKKRLAVLLCILLAAPTILGCLPMNTLKAEAAPASYYLWWIAGPSYQYNPTGESYREFSAEVGMTFNLGDFVYVSGDGKTPYLSTISGEKYKSSNTKVATVSSNGKVTVKSTGTTEFTITYKNITTTCRMQAVKAGANGSKKSAHVKAGKLGDTLIKKVGKKVTSSNRYAAAQAEGALDSYMEGLETLSYNGFLREKKDGYYSTTNKLSLPKLIEVNKASSKVFEYAALSNPVGTTASKWFKISSVSSKKNSSTFTVNLKKKVTDTQIFGIKYAYYKDDYIEPGNTAKFNIILVDKKTGYKYRGVAVAKKGSKKLTVTMNYLKLKKGRTYQLRGIDYDATGKTWAKNKTFKVK